MGRLAKVKSFLLWNLIIKGQKQKHWTINYISMCII